MKKYVLLSLFSFFLIYSQDSSAQEDRKAKQEARVKSLQAKLEVLIAQEVSADSLLNASEKTIDESDAIFNELYDKRKVELKAYKVESKQLKKELKTKDRETLKQVKADIRKLDKDHKAKIRAIEKEIKDKDRDLLKAEMNATKAEEKLKLLKGKIKDAEKKVTAAQEKLDEM